MESVVAVLVIIGAPILGSNGISFEIVDNILIRLLMLMVVILSIRQGPMPGLLVFLATYTVLLERNNQLLTFLPRQKFRIPIMNVGLPVQAPLLVPNKKEFSYEPKNVSTTVLREIEDSHAVVHYDDKSPEGESTDIKVVEGAEDLKDNIPHMPEAPRADKAPEFYSSRNL